MNVVKDVCKLVECCMSLSPVLELIERMHHVSAQCRVSYQLSPVLELIERMHHGEESFSSQRYCHVNTGSQTCLKQYQTSINFLKSRMFHNFEGKCKT